MKVCCEIRREPHYRSDAFRRGLKRIGGKFVDERDCDVLVIWNRYGGFRHTADNCERRGGTVLVAENGYLGVEWLGDRWYAISRGQHNGAGQWPAGGPERWDALGVELAPWRLWGREVVLLPQRGIGPPGVAMPGNWSREAAHKIGNRWPVRIRPHPGTKPAKPLDQDLHGAAAVATWGSGAALKSLMLGVPVFYDFPQWIGAPAGVSLDCAIKAPLRCDASRLAMFRRLAWAQWRLSEIESGEAFDRLLNG